MSYWIYLLNDAGEPVSVQLHSEGGTIRLGGEDVATINVTYNYCRHFDFKALQGKTGQETIAALEEAVARLGTTRDTDYWASRPGNAGHTCSVLLAWARLHPNAVWRVS